MREKKRTVGGDSSGAPAKPSNPVGTPPEVLFLSKPAFSRSVPEAGPASSLSVPAEGPASSHSVPDAEQNLAGGFDAVNSQRLLPDGAQEQWRMAIPVGPPGPTGFDETSRILL
jgi:hypothetical protein